MSDAESGRNEEEGDEEDEEGEEENEEEEEDEPDLAALPRLYQEGDSFGILAWRNEDESLRSLDQKKQQVGENVNAKTRHSMCGICVSKND